MKYFPTSVLVHLFFIPLASCTTISKTVTSDLGAPTLTIGSANALISDTSSLGIKATKNGVIQYDSIDGLIASIATSGEEEEKKTLGTLLVKSSDEACYKYLTEISTTEKTLRSGLGVSALLLSAASSVTTPVRSANLLSGISTATQGVEDELSNSILGGQDGDLLVQAVRKGRKSQRAAMADLLEGKQVNGKVVVKANFNRFLMEFPTYHDSCGISFARQVLRDAVNAAGSEENTKKNTDVNTNVTK